MEIVLLSLTGGFALLSDDSVLPIERFLDFEGWECEVDEADAVLIGDHHNGYAHVWLGSATLAEEVMH